MGGSSGFRRLTGAKYGVLSWIRVLSLSLAQQAVQIGSLLLPICSDIDLATSIPDVDVLGGVVVSWLGRSLNERSIGCR